LRDGGTLPSVDDQDLQSSSGQGKPEHADGDVPKVDPDAPPAQHNEDEPVLEDEPFKKQGDPLKHE